ncbi:hypothetical protein [Aquipuribacter nitratireducens]|uniref:Uncharacterized protein n=1 Tax=Aquipuribacter nitratireducens TaxID=650104 RepID=A0ABW0GIG1_9MICO
MTAGRVGLAESLAALRAVDERTDAAFTAGLRPEVDRFAALFDRLWDADATFRERWRPRPTRLAQLLSGRYLDARLTDVAAEAGVRIDRQVSEHGGGLDLVGTTRYKSAKGGRSLKLRGAFEPDSAARARACVGTRDARYRGGEGTYSIAELIVSPAGELLMLERDVTGGARHLWAYYVDGIASLRRPEDQRVVSPDIMDARMLRDPATGEWVHRTGRIRVHCTWLRTGCTAAWRQQAAWLDGDPGTGVVVVPAARPTGT